MQFDEGFLAFHQRAILDMTFGLHGRRQYTVLGMAREFGVTRDRIRGIQRKALRRLGQIVKARSAGQPLPAAMLADSWDYETLLSAMHELSSESPRRHRDLPLSKIKEHVSALREVESQTAQVVKGLAPHNAAELVQESVPKMKHEMSDQLGRFRRASLTTGRYYDYDVALSFAGPERHLARYVATALRQFGFRVFYDGFYPRQLWGKELTVEFDEIYRKKSRHCVIFVSPSYAERMWTHFERRSALARALEEKGNDYILPIEVKPAELPGIPPTIGQLSLQTFTIEQITGMLKKKLEETRADQELPDLTPEE